MPKLSPMIWTAVLLLSVPARAEDDSGTRSDVQAVVDGLGATTAPDSGCDREESPLCDDLFRFGCAPGTYNDGTGEASTPTSLNNRMEDLRRETIRTLRDRYLAELRNPANIYFRRVALAALGLQAAPQCVSDRASDRLRCHEDASSGLADLSIATVFPATAIPEPMPGTGGMGAGGMGGMEISDIAYLQQDTVYRRVLEDVGTSVRARVRNPEIIERIRTTIAPRVKELLTLRISASVTDSGVRDALVDKVNAITFRSDDCAELGGGDTDSNFSVSSLLLPNAFYDPISNTFNYCNGFLLQNTSEFQIVNVVAHELAHSIDPCGVTRAPAGLAFRYRSTERPAAEREYPFRGLISCLRTDESVGAAFREPGAMGPPFGGVGVPFPMPFPMPSPMPPVGVGGPTGAPAAPPPWPGFCALDQIGESVADWFGADITGEYMARHHPELTVEQFRIGYSNTFRGICSNAVAPSVGGFNPGLMMFDPHPSLERRVNRVLIANPRIRSQMGCPAQGEARACALRPAGSRDREDEEAACPQCATLGAVRPREGGSR